MRGRRRNGRREVLASIALVAVLFATLLVPAPAAAAPGPLPHDAVIWDGGRGGWVGQGVEDAFVVGQPGVDIEIYEASLDMVWLKLTSDDPSRGLGWADIQLAPPEGERFEPGPYEGAERIPFRDPTKPGISVSKDHQGCSWDRGRFVVHEASYGLLGALTSFSATFEHSCYGDDVTVGEVHLNSTRPIVAHAGGQPVLGFMAATPSEVVERVAVLGSVGEDPLTLGVAEIAGPDAVAFEVVEDGCSLAVLAPGEWCELVVTFHPSDGGDRRAWLDLPDDSGRGHRRWTLLGGVAVGPPPPPPAPPGTVLPFTALLIDRTEESPGNWYREEIFRPTDPDVQLRFELAATGARVFLSNEDGVRRPRSWTLTLTPTWGDWFEEGDYLGATRAAFRTGPRPGIDIGADGAGCNESTGSFTIHQLEFSPSGEVSRFAASWYEACKGVDTFESGEVRWNSTVPLVARRASTGVLDFGTVDVGQSAERSVTLTATGNAPLEVGEAFTTSEEYEVVTNGCAGRTLLPGSACTVRVRFAPTAGGRRDAELVIEDSSVGGRARVLLYGSGLELLPPPPPPPPPDPSPSPSPAPSPPSEPTPAASSPAPPRSGYWMLDRSGTVYAFGDAPGFGIPAVSAPAVDLEATPSGAGYWVVDAAGGVHAFGDAPYLGGAPALPSGEAVTSLSRTPSGRGYWLFTDRGRVLAFGDAPFLGDLGGRHLNGPVLDSIPTPTGGGYYLVASDGGVFTFGDAAFLGSMGASRLNAPVQSLVPDGDGRGYWLVASDGGIFAFDAPFHGSMGGTPLNRPVTGMVGATDGRGYLMVAEDGGIFAFGSVAFHGSLGDRPPAAPITSVATLP